LQKLARPITGIAQMGFLKLTDQARKNDAPPKPRPVSRRGYQSAGVFHRGLAPTASHEHHADCRTARQSLEAGGSSQWVMPMPESMGDVGD